MGDAQWPSMPTCQDLSPARDHISYDLRDPGVDVFWDPKAKIIESFL